MSGVLLDTHTWLWYAQGDTRKLPPRIVSALDTAWRRGALWVSAISIWEIGLLERADRLELSNPLRSWIEAALAAPGIRLAPIDALVAVESMSLPGDPPANTADRFLIATARVEGLRLATCDQRILDYSKNRAVKVLAV